MTDFRNAKYMPAVKRIIGPHLLMDSTFEQDTREATDLLVLNARDMRIACRVREPGYLPKFDNQITFRSRIDGAEFTELQKILRGWGDWFFYGHGIHRKSDSNIEYDIIKWWIVDLNAFRFHCFDEFPFIRIDKEISNKDGTYFTAFDLRKFSPEPPICIASSHPIPVFAEAAE